MKRFIFAIAILAFAQVVSAQHIETIWTNDDGIYEGYMSEQIPGKQLTVYAIRATITLKKETIESRYNVFRPVSSFEPENRQWLAERADTNKLALTSIYAGGVYYDDVFVLDESRSNIVFVVLRRASYVIPWNKLNRKEIRWNRDADYGLYDSVLLKDNQRFVGHIDKQYIRGNRMVMTLEDGKTVQEFPMTDIFSTSVEKMSEKKSIWSQAQLLDRVYVGDNKYYEGLIIARKNGEFIQLLDRTDSTKRKIMMKEITRYQKFLNGEYEEYFKPEVCDTTQIIMVDENTVTLEDADISSGKCIIADSLAVTVSTDKVLIKTHNYPDIKVFRAFKVKKSTSGNKIAPGEGWADLIEGDSFNSGYLRLSEPGLWIIMPEGLKKGFLIDYKK